LFKVKDMATGFYQCMKRVNRDMKFDSTIIFLCHREDVRNIVINMFEDSIKVEHSIDIEKMFIERNPPKTKVFMELCEELLKGEIPPAILDVLEDESFSEYEKDVEKGRIPKCVFAKCLNMTISSFGNNVLRDKKKQVAKFFKKNRIIVKNKTINFKGF